MGKTPKVVLGGSLVCAVLAITLNAQQPMMAGAKKVPGETWRNSMSMEMMGMTMPMPNGNKEACVPIGKAQEAMAAPDKDCQVYDTQRSGNRFSAKVKCTGQQKMEGAMESVSEGNRIRGTMHMRMADGNEATMKFDNTRIGKACEAIDYSGVKAPVVEVPQYAALDPCKAGLEQFQYTMFVGKNAQCAKSPQMKAFCAKVKSPSGFLTLDVEQRKAAGMDFSAYEKIKDVDFSAQKEPLTATFSSCGFDKSPAGVAAVRRNLLATAAAEINWDYILIEGDGGGGGAGGGSGGAGGQGGGGSGGGAGGAGSLGGAAQIQCTGRSYTSMSSNNPKYTQACRDYGYALSRGDYEGARGNAYKKFGLDYKGSGGPNAGPAAGGQATRVGAPTAGSAGEEAAANDSQTPADPNAKPEPNKTSEALKKGKKVLQGIFGR